MVSLIEGFNRELTFSIVISTYNRAYVLSRALESISVQTFRDFEVIIVDDGSTDGTRSMVFQWTNMVEFPVRYIWQKNQGRHVAYNKAFQTAVGHFSVILDSDDKLSPDALEIFLYIGTRYLMMKKRNLPVSKAYVQISRPGKFRANISP
jgi:glycosyltransferase involved in cell wall biosynthesis